MDQDKKVILVVGGRDFKDYELMKSKLDHLLQNHLPNVIIRSGTPPTVRYGKELPPEEWIGADRLAIRYAREKGLEEQIFLAEWNTFGKAAGMKRNLAMADGPPIPYAVIAFWDGQSRGTANMIGISKKREFPLRVIRYDKDITGPILFTKEDPQYGFMSNFWASPIEYKGLKYRTAEHLFQSAKTLDPIAKEEIATTPTPARARTLGRKAPLRDNWEEIKVDVMRHVLRLKFGQNRQLLARLKATGNRKLVERADWDNFWGDGKDRNGNNMLGKLLMEIRDKKEEE